MINEMILKFCEFSISKVLTAKLLRQEYRYNKTRKAFSKFYRRHFDIVFKYNVGIKRLFSAMPFRTRILWRLGE